MRTIRILITFTAVVMTIISCSGNKEMQLAKLKKQQAVLDEKIRSYESKSIPAAEDPIDPGKFRFVGIRYIKSDVFDHFIKVQGKLDGDHNAAVFADVAGIVASKYADVGKNVKKGQVLAQIDDRQYRSQLESLETQYEFATQMYEKQKRLWEQSIGSEVQYLQAKASKESLEQQISSLREQIEKFKIKSPIDGTIEESNIKLGSVVSPNPNSPIFRVVAFTGLKVTAEVSEAYAAKVKTGDRVLVTFPDIEREIETRIDFVSRYINPDNRTFSIESRIPGRFPGMKANMVAIVRINDYHSDNALQVPVNVIQTDGEGSYVYVVRNKDNFDGAFKQPVIIGNTYNGVAEIIKGLSDNDIIVTAGFQELIDGEYVRFDKPQEAILSKN